MAHDCMITARLLRRQVEFFRVADSEFGFSHKVFHLETGMSLSAIGQYARGETAMSGPAIMKVAEMRDLKSSTLSILFEGTGRVTVDEDDDGDPANLAGKCLDFAGEYQNARHPDSEAGVDIGPNEGKRLQGKRADLRVAVGQ